MIFKYLLPFLSVLGMGFAIVTVVNGSKTIPSAQPVVDPTVPLFESSVAGAGIIEANTENIAIGTLVAGVVSNVYISVGSKVKAGDPLFKIDDRDLSAQLLVKKAALKVAESAVNVAKATLADLKRQLALAESISDKRAISVEDLDKRRYAVRIAMAKLAQARAEIISSRSQVLEVETNLQRLTVCAPCDGVALQVKIHVGEFAQAGALQTPLILFGNVEPLCGRVDIDEDDAWRVRPEAPAAAFLRGNRKIKVPLRFRHFEPYVIPKKSLTGSSVERVDTRVLQAVYTIERADLPVFIGQQMDVFIESVARPPAAYSSASTKERQPEASGVKQ